MRKTIILTEQQYNRLLETNDGDHIMNIILKFLENNKGGVYDDVEGDSFGRDEKGREHPNYIKIFKPGKDEKGERVLHARIIHDTQTGKIKLRAWDENLKSIEIDITNNPTQVLKDFLGGKPLM